MIKRLFIRLFLLGALIWSIFWLLDHAMTKKALEDKCRRSNWVFSFKKQHFDFVFCGDSRAYNMVDISTVQNLTGKRGLNIGYSGAIFEEQYLIIRKFVENGNTINQLFLQTDLQSFDSSKRSRHRFTEYNYLPYLESDTLTANVVRDNTPSINFFLWKNVPFIKYIEFNMKYPISLLMKNFDDCIPEFDKFGSDLLPRTSTNFTQSAEEFVPKNANPSLIKPALNKSEYINAKTMDYFERIVQLCKNRRIDLILYTPPLYISLTKNEAHKNDCINFIDEIASYNQLQYLEFLNDSICHNHSNFYDAAHTNAVGTMKFSERIAQFIN